MDLYLYFAGNLVSHLYFKIFFYTILDYFLKVFQKKSRWCITDRPWDLDLHNFKQLLQIFMAARIG
jgi:hypothetical protein